MRVPSEHVRSPLAAIACLPLPERVRLPANAFLVLPGYAPCLTRPFEDWLDLLRTRLQRSVRRILEADLETLRSASDWTRLATVARTLLTLDPQHLTALKVLVESSFVTADATEALAALDDFLDEASDKDTELRAEVDLLRRRVSNSRRAGIASPLIGRAEALASLSEAWACAERGTTQYVLLTGPAGIGKTRVSAALRELVASRGGHIIDHACGDNDRHRPLSFFVKLSAALLALPGSLGVSPSAYSHITRLSLSASAPPEALPDAITSESVRAEIHDALIDLFDAVSAEIPLLVIVDDAHLLDPASWAVLRALSGRVRTRSAMVLLSTRSTSQLQAQALLPQRSVIVLGHLSAEDSRTLLLSLAPQDSFSEVELREALRLAAGNPFFIQALARSSSWVTRAQVPLDITALASRTYHSLHESTRTVLECVLALKDLATLHRVRSVALVDDDTFLRSLRLLEEEGVVHCTGQDVRCSHDLLADALRPLVPTTVAAILRERIAAQLESECVERGFDAALAWASADAWLLSGNSMAAARLLRRCAANAAHLAEHSEAARILSRLLSVPLPADDALPLIDEIIAYAELGGERSIRARALRARLRLMEEQSVGLSDTSGLDISSVRIAIAEADLNEAGDLQTLIAESWSAIADTSLDLNLRMRAGVALLTAADLGLDPKLSAKCWQQLNPIAEKLGSEHTQALRGRLIYHTVFGDSRLAVRIAQRILRTHPMTQVDVASVGARRNALFALQILGRSAAFRPTAINAYALMIDRKIFTEAVYLAVTLAEDAIASGDLSTALSWLRRAGGAVGRLHETAEGITQGYLSALSSIATHSGDYSTARSLLTQVHQRLRLVATPRLRGINTAYLVRLAILQNQALPPDCSLEGLRRDYDAGCRLGRQDTIVEGLWLGYVRGEMLSEANHLLREYFQRYRREDCHADWSLWHSTRADRFWQDNRSWVPPARRYSSVSPDSVGAVISLCAAPS